jgi:hypothetical protein
MEASVEAGEEWSDVVTGHWWRRISGEARGQRASRPWLLLWGGSCGWWGRGEVVGEAGHGYL